MALSYVPATLRPAVTCYFVMLDIPDICRTGNTLYMLLYYVTLNSTCQTYARSRLGQRIGRDNRKNRKKCRLHGLLQNQIILNHVGRQMPLLVSLAHWFNQPRNQLVLSNIILRRYFPSWYYLLICILWALFSVWCMVLLGIRYVEVYQDPGDNKNTIKYY